MAATYAQTGKPFSASTIHAMLGALKAFFVWLADQQGYALRIKYEDAEYFNAPDNLSRIATARRFKSCPTLAQVRTMIDAMQNETDSQRRDRAIIAFAILSGARDRAIISFRLKHIDIEHDLIEHDARDVRTKRAKTFTTWFFPVGDDIRQIVVDWIAYLRGEKGFGRDDPLFPKTWSRRAKTSPSARCLSTARLGRTPIRFARFSAKPAQGLDCRISTRTCCETRSFKLRMIGTSTPKPSRLGHRTSGMKVV